MMKFLSLILIGFTIAFFSGSCCSLLDNDLNKFVDGQLQKSKSGVMDFRKFESTSWDKMYIITPYAAPGAFDSTLIKSKDDIMDTGIGEGDAFFLIVLADHDQVVRIAKFTNSSLGQMMIIKNNKFGFYTKEKAVFDYREVDNFISATSKEIIYKHTSDQWKERWDDKPHPKK